MDRDYQGIIWELASCTGYTPPPDQDPSWLIYDDLQYRTIPHCGGYSRPCSLPEGGNPDLDFVGGPLSASVYALTAEGLTLRSDPPESYEFVFEGR